MRFVAWVRITCLILHYEVPVAKYYDDIAIFSNLNYVQLGSAWARKERDVDNNIIVEVPSK